MANIIKVLLALFSAVSQVAQWFNTRAATKAGEDSAKRKAAENEAETRLAQDKAGVDVGSDINTADGFADRVRDEGF